MWEFISTPPSGAGGGLLIDGSVNPGGMSGLYGGTAGFSPRQQQGLPSLFMTEVLQGSAVGHHQDRSQAETFSLCPQS